MNPELLQPFCSTDYTRPWLAAPFNHEGHTYATDGRIMIRVPAIPGIERPDHAPSNPGCVIPAGDGFQPVEFPPGWEGFEIPIVPCSDCKGTGHLRQCPDCQGAGSIVCDSCDHEHTCRNCRETGSLPCTAEATGAAPCLECDGLGTHPEMFRVSLNRGEVIADLRYLRLATALPGCRITYLDGRSPLRIEFDGGGEGCLMPISGRYAPDLNVAATRDQWRD